MGVPKALGGGSTNSGITEKLVPAVAKFAQCLQVIPKTLAINAALDAADLVSKLRAFHNESQCNEARAGFRFCGLDLVKGCIRDNKKAGRILLFLLKGRPLPLKSSFVGVSVVASFYP